MEAGWLVFQSFPAPVNLLLQGSYMGRKESMEGEGIPFFLGEGGSLVEPRVVQQVVAGKAGTNNIAAWVDIYLRWCAHAWLQKDTGDVIREQSPEFPQN